MTIRAIRYVLVKHRLEELYKEYKSIKKVSDNFIDPLTGKKINYHKAYRILKGGVSNG